MSTGQANDRDARRRTGTDSPTDWTPRPDPTVLTTDIVNGAKTDLRRESHALRELVETRITGIDSILKIVTGQISDARHDRSVQIGESVTALKSLYDERFDAVGQKFDEVREQFATVERLRVEQKIDTKTAVDAAFAASEKSQTAVTAASDRAIAKSEASTKEQLVSLAETFTTAIAGITRSLDDQKDRLNSLELRLTSRLDTTGGVATGGAESRNEARLDAGAGHAQTQARTAIYAASIAAILMLVAIIGLVVVLSGRTSNQGPVVCGTTTPVVCR